MSSSSTYVEPGTGHRSRSLLRRPILSRLLDRRSTGVAIVAMALAQVVLTLLSLPGWTCPILFMTGHPCPGCGLSRATSALLRGDLHSMWHLHAFAPLLVVTVGLSAISALVSGARRRRLLERLASFERRTGLTSLLLVGLLAYWLVRLF